MRLSFILLFAACTLVLGHAPESRPTIHPDSEDHSLEGVIFSSYESRYYSEGRDALDGDSIWINSLELAYENISGGVWYGNSPDQDYDELQLSVGVGQAFGDFEISGGYTFLYFPFESSKDHELGATLAWSNLPLGMELSVDPYYSFDADGIFVEVALGREVQVTEEISLNISGIYAMNQGYVSDGHDGSNNIALKLGGDLALTESLLLSLHATYSWAISQDLALEGDAQLIDFFHLGVGVIWEF